jgi:hypothetical protein
MSSLCNNLGVAAAKFVAVNMLLQFNRQFDLLFLDYQVGQDALKE